MMFNSVKGYPGSRIPVGMHASRERAALLLGCEPSKLAQHVGQAVKTRLHRWWFRPRRHRAEQVFYADDPDFDLRKLLPAPTNTPIDAGPFFCLGLVLASDPEDTSLTDVTIHRLCVQERDELSMFLAAGRHIEVFRKKAEAAGKPLPVTINMGLDPAIYIGACFEAPTTPFGYNELGVAGALRQQPVELVQGVAVKKSDRAGGNHHRGRTASRRARKRRSAHQHRPRHAGVPGLLRRGESISAGDQSESRDDAKPRDPADAGGPGRRAHHACRFADRGQHSQRGRRGHSRLLQNVYAHTAGGGKFLGILQVKTPAVRRRTSGRRHLSPATYSELKTLSSWMKTWISSTATISCGQ